MTNCCGFPSKVSKRGPVIETGRGNSWIPPAWGELMAKGTKLFELATTTVQFLVGGGFVQFDSWLPAELMN